MSETKLPTHTECMNAIESKEFTSLDLFIYEQEPAGRGEVQFRMQLTDVISYFQTQLDKLKENLHDALFLPISEYCSKYHFQDCSHCERLECCDNTSQLNEAKKALEEIKENACYARVNKCGDELYYGKIESIATSVIEQLKQS